MREDVVAYFKPECEIIIHLPVILYRHRVQAIIGRLGNVVDYVRKQVGRDRAEEDITLILPRARSELT